MRDALVAAGVPTNAITTDYAGFRTLDSIVRAKTVFGLTNFTIVTEGFIAHAQCGLHSVTALNVVAFAAPGLEYPLVRRVKLWEALARTWCAWISTF